MVIGTLLAVEIAAVVLWAHGDILAGWASGLRSSVSTVSPLGFVSRTRVLRNFDENIEEDLTSGNLPDFLRANFLLVALLFLFLSTVFGPARSSPGTTQQSDPEEGARAEPRRRHYRDLFKVGYVFVAPVGSVLAAIMVSIIWILFAIPYFVLVVPIRFLLRLFGRQSAARSDARAVHRTLFDAVIAVWGALFVTLRSALEVLAIFLVLAVFVPFHYLVVMPVSYLAYLIASRITKELMDATSSSDLAVVHSESPSKKQTVLALRDMAEEDSLAFKSFLIRCLRRSRGLDRQDSRSLCLRHPRNLIVEPFDWHSRPLPSSSDAEATVRVPTLGAACLGELFL